MRLKEIKLAGFKSFVDPTTVRLPGNRNAVVGPNGCGKSNVIDAVRWVMGESSAKQLRGASLTDVIFNGSGARGPTGLASIELLFDNRDGRVGGEFAQYAEIAIRRDVSRVAQSSYYLNGTKCRRRDIADVFLGTGFGPRSYSIIEQGMISQLVEAKPEELRAYLEEAAGISRYKERRRETQNRIRHTEENLARLTDLCEELARQLAHLKRQAKAAERFRELKEEQRQRTAELHAIRINANIAEAERETAKAQALGVEHEAALADKQSLETALERSRADHEEKADEINETQGRYYQVRADVARLEQAIDFNRERVRQLEEDAAAVAEQSRQAAAQLGSDAQRIRELQERIAASKPSLEEAAARDVLAAERLEEFETKARAAQRGWDDFSARRHGNERQRDAQEGRIEYGERALARLRERASSLDAEPAAPNADGLESQAGELAAAERAHEAAAAAVDANREAAAAATDAVRHSEQALATASAEAQQQRRDLAAMAAVQEAALGREAASPGAVQEWLDANGLTDAPRLGERLAVEAGWERAAELVLGSRIQAVAVDDDAAFAASLEELPQGQVTLLAGSAAPTRDGDLKRLADFVQGGTGSLLAGVFAAESLAEALAARPRLAPGQSIVTKSGLWLGADWLRVERGADAETGVLTRAKALEALEADVAEADARAEFCEEALLAARGRAAALAEERDALQQQRSEAAAAASRARAEYDAHRARQAEAIARAERTAGERREVAAQIGAETDAVEAARNELAELATAADALADEGRRLAQLRERLGADLDAVRNAAREATHAHDHERVEHQSLIAMLSATETSRERLQSQRQEFARRGEELQVAIAEAEDQAPALKEDLQEKIAARVAIEAELLKHRREAEAIETQIRALTGRRGEAEQQVEAVRSRLEAVRMECERLAAHRQDLDARLAETGIDLATATSALPEDAAETAWVETLESLDRRIGRLGPINLAAIDEYETQSERKEYLDRQHPDLETALETLRGAIRRIDRDTRTRFKETFDEVNQHLKVLFPKVFGGGHAYLELAGEDWLDTGVSLMAQPPGKRNASIQLLSGGEKALTAIALIFAIFQLNPSPVCLLDEVDAPLDDVNVVRFAELIREMSDQVQFVVITHNKQTIEMADHLLGVTMQEAGVSRLVSVDVEQAALMAAG